MFEVNYGICIDGLELVPQLGAGTKAKQERATYKGSSVVTQYIFLDLFPSYDNKLLKSC